ncbi:integrase, catalytic region, zinc finger, CCHC-type containing protein, partial [Tanacetum coccineum]
MDTRSTSMDNLIESLTNTLALLRMSSNARNKAIVEDDRVVVQDVRDRYNVNNQGRPFQRNNGKRSCSWECWEVRTEKQVTNFDDVWYGFGTQCDNVFEDDNGEASTLIIESVSTQYSVKLVPEFYPTKRVQTTLFKEVKVMEEIFDQMNDEVDQNTETSNDVPEFNSFFKINNLENQIQEKDNVIRDLKVLVSNVNNRSCEPYNTNDVTDLLEQNERLRAEIEKELLEYVIGTCPKSFNERDNKAPSTPVTWKKQVTFNDKPGTSSSNTQKHEVHQKVQQTNVHVIHSTGVNTSTEASRSKPRSNTKKNRIVPAKSERKKKVEDHPRTDKSVWTKVNWVDSSISSKRVVINSNSESVCKTCNKCLNSTNHKMCVVNILSSVNATPTVNIVLNKGKQIWKPKGKLSINSLNKSKRVWKATGKLFADIGYQWRPTGKRFTLGKLNCGYQWRPTGKKFALGELCPLTKLSVKCRTGRDMNGVDLLKGSRSTNLYTISIDDMMKSSPVCLLSKASKTKSWLWHRRLNHLNFGTINDLARKDLVRGLPRLKFAKDHLCSACQLGKSKKYSHKPKSENTNMEVLHTLHMDLCGPMRVQSINGKKYILVIVDDYSRFTWSVPRTPQQNGVVKIRNRTLVEAAHTMLIFLKAPMFLWAAAVATACYTHNRSLIHTRHNKTPYEIMHVKKPDLTFLRVFGALCYPTNDSKDLGKLQEGFSNLQQKNPGEPDMMEIIHVTFDELHQTMAHVRISSGPEPIMMTPRQLNSGLAPSPAPATTYIPPTDKDLEILFQLMFDEYFEQSTDSEPVP